MTTLDAKAVAKSQTTDSESAPAPTVEQSVDISARITEQQVLFGSAAALAPAKTRRWSHATHQVSAAVRSMFVRPEKPRARKHYPQRYAYLENAAMSRAMDRL